MSSLFAPETLAALEAHWLDACADPTTQAQMLCERAAELERAAPDPAPGQRGRSRASYEHWRRALELEPRLLAPRAALLRYVGSELLDAAEREALVARLEALCSRAEQIELRVRLARLAARRGEAPAAEARLREALELDPGNRQVLAELEALARRCGAPAQLCAWQTRLAEVTTDARLQAGLALQTALVHETVLGDRAGAARQARAGLAAVPGDHSLHRVASRVQVATAQWRAAAQLLEHEAERLGGDALAATRYEEAARLYARRLGSYAQAQRAVERGVELAHEPGLLRLAREIALDGGSASDDALAHSCAQLARAASTPTERARYLWLLSEELGEGPEATAALEEAIAAAPDYLSAALALELACYQPGASAERIDALARRGRAEGTPALLVQAGRLALEELGDAARAEALFREALGLVRTSEALFGPLGAAEALHELLAAHGRADDEVALVRWLLEQALDPARRTALQNRLADLHTRAGRTDEAVDAWRRVLSLDAHDGHAHERLASVLRAAGRFEELFEARESALVLTEITDRERAEPLRWECAELLARRLGRVDDALALLEQGLERAPGFLPHRVSSARLLIEHRHDHGLAARYRRELEHASPGADAARLALNLGLLNELRLRDPDAAAHCYTLALEHHPDELAALLGLVRTGDAASRPEATTGALRRLAHGCADAPLRSALFFELAARLDAVHGDLEAACEAYASSLEAAPASAAANIAWEACAVRLGQFDAVKTRLASMIELAADTPDAVEWLERALFLAEPHEEAALVAQLLARVPGHLGAHLRRLLSTLGQPGATAPAQAAAARALADALPPGTLQAALLEAAVLLEDHAPATARLHGDDTADALWRIIEVRHDEAAALVRLLARQRSAPGGRDAIKIHGALARGATLPAEQAFWLTGLARLLADDGQYDRASLALEEVLRVQPNHLAAIRLLRILAEDVGERERLAAAVELEARAVDDPRLAIEHLLRAAEVRRRQLGDVDGAASALEEILRIDAEHEQAFVELQDIYTSGSRFDALYELLRRRAEGTRDPERRRRTLLRAAELAYDTMRDMHRAIAAHQRVIELEPRFVRSWRVIAEIHLECQHWAEGADALRGVLGLAQDKRLLGRTWFRLGEVCDEHLGQTDRAIEAFRRALEQMPEHIESLYRLADIFERIGRLDETVTCLEALGQLERTPLKRKEVLLRLSQLLLERFGDADRAQDFLVIAREIDPSDVALTRQLADAYAKRNWTERRLSFLRSSFVEYRDRFEQNVTRPSPLHAMHAIAEWLGDTDRAFTLASVLSFVGAASEAQQESYRATLDAAGLRLPKRALPIARTSGIFAAGLHVNILHVMRHADPHLARFSPSAQRLRGVRRSHRESPGSRRELAALQTFAGAFGIPLPELYLVPDRGESLAFAAGDEPAFVLDPRDLEPVLLPETMARVAIGCATLAMGLGNFASMDAATFEMALLGVCQAVLPERRFGRPEQAAALENVARAVPRKVAESLTGYVLEISDQLERERIRAQHQAVIATSMRLGLLTMFDPRPGLTVIARDGDAGHFDVVAVMKDALMFLVGDRYAELRHEAGIGLGGSAAPAG